MKAQLCVAIGGFAIAAIAADVPVPANDSAAFRKAVYDNHNTGNTIVLPPGRYDASGATERKAGYCFDITGMKIRGNTDNPRDVVIYGDGTKAIFFGSNGGATASYIDYVTISNGCNATSDGGGACKSVYMLSHCVVTHCKATAGWGGALRNCNAQDSEICYNSCTTFGGGAAEGIFTRCEMHHNTATTAGGAGFRTTASNCFVHENTSAVGGAFSAHASPWTLDGCTVVSNTATGGGGAVRNYSSTMDIRNCTFAYNKATNSDGGAVFDGSVSNCVFVGNSAKNGGAIGGGVVTAQDCRFQGNSAAATGGAAYKTVTIARSVLSGNTAADGGAVAGTGRDVRAVLVDCVISNNSSTTSAGGAYYCKINDSEILLNKSVSSGGGVRECVVSNCVIAGNALTGASTQGGGCYYTDCIDSKIYNNYGMYGSALSVGSATGCVISNNVSPHGVYSIRPASGFVNCYLDVQGIDSPGRLVNCIVTGAGRPIVWAEGDNVYTKGTFNGRTDRCVENSMANQPIMAATNCLFAGNMCSTLFHGPTSRKDGLVTLAACTIAGNQYDNLLNNAPGAADCDGRFQFENCVIGDNVSMDGQEARGFHPYPENQSWNVGVESCLFESMVSGWVSAIGTNNVIVAGARFNKDDAEHPHSLKRSSPARRIGVVRDWMTGANDIRGEGFPRLDEDNRVDLGCYQCWLEPTGLSVIVR